MSDATHHTPIFPRVADCPSCGATGQTVGAPCQVCGARVDRRPIWARSGLPNRRLRRRLAIYGSLALLLGLLLWIYYPFLPDVPTLLFRRPATDLTSASEPLQWSMTGHDLQQRKRVAEVTRLPRGQVLWSQYLGEFTRSAPALRDGVMYLGGYFKIMALDPATGEARWEVPTSGPVQSSPALSGDLVYVGLLDGRFQALDREKGELVWEFDTRNSITASPVVADGIVYFGSWNGLLHARDAATGKPIWEFQTGGLINTAPALFDGKLFVSANNGDLNALNARTGQQRLHFRTVGPVVGTPAVDYGLVYFPSGGTLYAIDSEAREIPGQYQFKQVWAQLWLWQVPGVSRPPGQRGGVWRISPGGSAVSDIIGSPAVADETIYFGDSAGNFYGRDAHLGDELWRFSADSPVVAAPALAGDAVYFGTTDGTLYALDRATGRLRWSLSLGASIEVPPTFTGDRLYVRTSDGWLHAIE